MEKTQNAKFVKFALSAAACFALLFFAMLASAGAVNAAPMPEMPAGAEPTANATMPMPATEVPSAAYGGGGAADGADLEAKMREALTAVKKVIDIDEKIYVNFNYYYYPDASGNDNWNFIWYSKDGNANINATVLGNGRVLYYGKYDYDEKYASKQVRFAELTKAQAAAKAEAFLKKMLGREFEGYRLYYQSLSYPSDRYSLVYVLAKNGYDYPDFQLYADVDKITGDILSFSNFRYDYAGSDAFEFEYQSASSVISRQEALDSYLENIGIELIYTSYYDYESREHKIHPVYRLKNNYDEYISAADGSVVEIADPSGFMPLPMPRAEAESAKAMSADSGGMGGAVSFSEAELTELAKAGGYITADEAVAIIAKAFDLAPADLENFTVNTYLESDYMDRDKYLWGISMYSSSETMYENHYATVDAKTGTIIYYSGSSYSVYGPAKGQDPGRAYTFEQAKEAALEKIREICPADIDADFELVSFNDEKGAASYYFNFQRKVNGILFDGNGVSVSFDSIAGKISHYSFRWFDKADFPKLSKIVSPEKALGKIADYAGYDIYYTSNGLTEDGKINAVLVYKFGASVYVDPFTGKCIDWNFEEAAAPAVDPDYKDLEGHWGENTVWTLTNNGIYVWGGTIFNPDAAITKGELVSYLRFFAYNAYYFTQIESSIFVNQFAYRQMDAYSSGADADKILTKQEAAKIVCEIAGYGELGQHTEIFAYPFNDDNCDAEYRGYVAIMKAFGLILGDEDGNYDGTKTLTRAEAAAIIYNIVMTFGEN